jgi:hypothetical protein
MLLIVGSNTASRSSRQVIERFNGTDSQDWQENTPENSRERETLPLRQVPQKKPEACQDACPVVLPDVPETTGR